MNEKKRRHSYQNLCPIRLSYKYVYFHDFHRKLECHIIIVSKIHHYCFLNIKQNKNKMLELIFNILETVQGL